MVYVLFGLFIAVLVLASPFAFRRLRHSRDARTAGGPPARPEGAGRAAVPVQPSAEREPFHYGGILTIEPHDEEKS